MNNLKKISLVFYLLFVVVQISIAQKTLISYAGPTYSSCFDMDPLVTRDNGTETCYDITITFDDGVLAPGQNVNVEVFGIQSNLKESCSTSPCVIRDWCFPKDALPYEINLRCWTDGADPLGISAMAAPFGYCLQSDGCIVIIGG